MFGRFGAAESMSTPAGTHQREVRSLDMFLGHLADHHTTHTHNTSPLAYLFQEGENGEHAARVKATTSFLARTEAAHAHYPGFSLLGKLIPIDAQSHTDEVQGQVFINTSEPFCVATVGVQGGGKSHTLNSILESCLLPLSLPKGASNGGAEEIVRLEQPMTALVLHYDPLESLCEAAGLATPNPTLARALASPGTHTQTTQLCVPRERVVVLVSPTMYKQRVKFYASHFTVKPLLLDWTKLTASQLLSLMRLQDNDSLYVFTMLDLLRRYQRRDEIPSFALFEQEVLSACDVRGQCGPLQQRLNLLKNIIQQSSLNESLRRQGGDVLSECAPGKLIILDLSDPMLSPEEANCIFQVATEQFRAFKQPKAVGKLLVLDEAHRYMSGDTCTTNGLSEEVVKTARMMRHDGMRLAISTQNPRVLAPELLELVSGVVIHRFHSQDWFDYLQAKLGLRERDMKCIARLSPGEALVFASRNLVDENEKTFHVKIRPRITADFGGSVRNK